MATKTYNIDINVQSKTLGQLEDQLAQVNEELKQVDRNSEAFKNLTKEAQSLTAEIKRTNTQIEGFTFEKKIEAADGAVKLMAGSLASVVGVLGTLGIESEAFGDLERKAASAIAVAIGIKDVSEGIQRLSPALKAAGLAFTRFGAVTKTALITTGVGLFVVAIGTIASYWDDIKVAIGLTKDENEKLNDSFEESLGYSEDTLTLLRLEKGLLETKGEDQEAVNKKILKELEAQVAITEQMILQNEIALKEEEEENAKITNTIEEGIGVQQDAHVQAHKDALDRIAERQNAEMEAFQKSQALVMKNFLAEKKSNDAKNSPSLKASLTACASWLLSNSQA